MFEVFADTGRGEDGEEAGRRLGVRLFLDLLGLLEELWVVLDQAVPCLAFQELHHAPCEFTVLGYPLIDL